VWAAEGERTIITAYELIHQANSERGARDTAQEEDPDTPQMSG